MQVEKFNIIPHLSDTQISTQRSKILKFIKVIHPKLDANGVNDDVFTEIRVIKDSEKNFSKSWMLNSHPIERNRQIHNILDFINGKLYTVCYSVYNYNSEDNKCADGTQKIVRINNQNAFSTQILIADFDNIEEDEFLKYKEMLSSIGISTLNIFTGHGFHLIILLTEAIQDTSILKSFNKLLQRKGFPVDTRIIDPARIMRMPETFNCKGLAGSKKYENVAIKTFIYNWTEERYSMDDTFYKIESLPDDTNYVEKVTNKTNPTNISESNKKSEEPIKKLEDHEFIEKIQEAINLYKPIIDISGFDLGIKKMLSYCPEGVRNSTMLFFVPLLINKMGLSIEKVREILSIWRTRCDPELSQYEINSSLNGILKAKFEKSQGKYIKELADVYGWIKFNNYNSKETIYINQSFFNRFSVLPDISVRIYLCLKLEDTLNGKKNYNYTKFELAKLSGVCERTIELKCKELINSSFLVKKNGKRRNKEQNKYYLNKIFNGTEGFTYFCINEVEKLLSSALTDGEIKLYLLIRNIISKNFEKCTFSQERLAKMIGRKRHSSITIMTKNLEQQGFITKTTNRINGIKHSEYQCCS